MKTNIFSDYLFWSYQKNVDLPADIVVRQVILYGEVSDMIKLSDEVDHAFIGQIANELSNISKFTLVGGTALSLQLCHRLSEDLAFIFDGESLNMTWIKSTVHGLLYFRNKKNKI